MRIVTPVLASVLGFASLMLVPSLGVVSTAVAQQPAAQTAIRIDNPWVRATAPGAKAAGGFLVLTNTGTTPDRLTGGAVDFAENVEVHEMAMENNVMKMRRLEAGLEVAPGAAIELKPGSYHLMFVGLKRQLTDGEVVKVTLTFEKAGKVEASVPVKGMRMKSDHSSSH